MAQSQGGQKERGDVAWLVGAVLRVTTHRDEVIDGEVYAYDPSTAALVLRLCMMPLEHRHAAFSP